MNDLIKIENVNGDFLTTSKNIAEVFGKDHKHVMEAIRNLGCPEDFEGSNFRPSSYRNGGNRLHPMYLVTMDGFSLLAMGFSGQKAMEFKIKYIAAFRKMESVILKTSSAELDPGLPILKFIADDLRVNEASRLLMYEKYLIETGNHAAVKALPDYTEESRTSPLSELLKEHGVSLSAIKANKILIDFGILEERERKASKGKIKKYKSLTEDGLEYGKNLISPHNQKETQPHYFADRFSDLSNRFFLGQ